MAVESRKVKKNLNLQPITLSTLTTPEAGDIACDKDDSNKIKQYDSVASVWKTLAGGSGGINYIGSADGDSTAGWTVVGAGIAWTSQNTVVLRDTRSFKFAKSAVDCTGQYVYYRFTLANADKGKSLYESFDVDASHANYVVDYLSFDVQSNTASDWSGTTSTIPVRGSIVNGRGTFSFPTSADIYYQIRIKVNTATTTAWDVYFDNFVVGPDKLIDGPINEDWKPSTFTTGMTNTTIVSSEKRVGDTLFAKGLISCTGTPAGTFGITLPYSIDSSKITYTSSTQIGNITILIGSNRYTGIIRYTGAVSGSFLVDTGSLLSSVSATVPATFASGSTIAFEIMVPVTQWANQSAVLSTTEMMNSTDSFTVYKNNGNQTCNAIVGGENTLITFNALSPNSLLNSYNTTTNLYTANKKKRVLATANISLANGAVVSIARTLSFKVNSTTGYGVIREDSTVQQNNAISISAVLDLNANDTVGVNLAASMSSGSSTVVAVNGNCCFSITELPDFSVYGVYGMFERKYVVATDFPLSTSGFVSGEWAAVPSGTNGIPLTEGTYLLGGTIQTYMATGVVCELYAAYGTANGDNTTTTPSTAGLVILAGNNYFNTRLTTGESSDSASPPPLIIIVSTPITLYLNAKLTFSGTVAASFITARHWALRLR